MYKRQEDGGLFVPETIPTITIDEIKSLIPDSYAQRTAFVLSKFLTDYTYEELLIAANEAYAKEKFSPSPAPVVSLNEKQKILELWHGPTCAFKDMALQIMPRLLSMALKKTGEKRTALILVATSGDTGKAALEGYKDIDQVKIMVFYPEDGVRDVYKRQTFHVKNRIVNLRGTEQEYFYLCHINFRPVDGARLVYSAKKEDIFTHVLIPDNMNPADKSKLEKYFEYLQKDVSNHDVIGGDEQFYKPEIVFTVKYQKDENGRGHCMQVLPDGYACYVSHFPDQLPYGIRWICRMENEDALGMLLPATGEHNGYHDCVKKGYVRYMPVGKDVVLEFDVGMLRPEHATELTEKI